MSYQLEPGEVRIAAPILIPMLEKKRDQAVRDLLNVFNTGEATNQQIRDKCAELNVCDKLRSSFREALTQAQATA